MALFKKQNAPDTPEARCLLRVSRALPLDDITVHDTFAVRRPPEDIDDEALGGVSLCLEPLFGDSVEEVSNESPFL